MDGRGRDLPLDRKVFDLQESKGKEHFPDP